MSGLGKSIRGNPGKYLWIKTDQVAEGSALKLENKHMRHSIPGRPISMSGVCS